MIYMNRLKYKLYFKRINRYKVSSLRYSDLSLTKKAVDRVYVTSLEGNRKNSPIILGLMDTLEQRYRSIGYFRPIVPSITKSSLSQIPDSLNNNEKDKSDHHVELIKKEFNLNSDIRSLYGVTEEEALRKWMSGEGDDLLDQIITSFDTLKLKHDFIVIEGTQFGEIRSSLWNLNVSIAKALGAPVIINIDAEALTRKKDNNFIQEMYMKALIAKDTIKKTSLSLVGIIFNRVHSMDPNIISKSLEELLLTQKIPFLGILPYDITLASKRLNEVVQKLNATQLYGNNNINNIEVTDAIVATSGLKEIFNYMKPKRPGLLVITSADRIDLILGLLAARISGVLPNVAGVILTNGNQPQEHVKSILNGVMKLDKQGLSMPIFTVIDDSYRTANNLSRISDDLLPTSKRKIEQAKLLFQNFIKKSFLVDELSREPSEIRRSPNQFKHFIMSSAKEANQHIVLTEGEDDRILCAADELLQKEISTKLTILTTSEPDNVHLRAKSLNIDLSKANIINPTKSPLFEEYVQSFFRLREHKGVTIDVARDTLVDPTYFGTMMVEAGHADGMVSGACHTTANTIRPAMQIIKGPTKGRTLVSSIFFMCLNDGVRIYGDCAVNTNPTAEELAQIAVTSAESAEAFGIIPRVALLSYATGDSNKGPIIDKVREATLIAKKMAPKVAIYGPIQYDAAVNPLIAKKKLHEATEGAQVGGHANVLIFPDLNTGNNTYKAVQQSTQCLAIGPMLQGLKKPVNDLSRGATIPDIVTTVALTAIQARQMKKKIH